MASSWAEMSAKSPRADFTPAFAVTDANELVASLDFDISDVVAGAVASVVAEDVVVVPNILADETVIYNSA